MSACLCNSHHLLIQGRDSCLPRRLRDTRYRIPVGSTLPPEHHGSSPPTRARVGTHIFRFRNRDFSSTSSQHREPTDTLTHFIACITCKPTRKREQYSVNLTITRVSTLQSLLVFIKENHGKEPRRHSPISFPGILVKYHVPALQVVSRGS
jgi:hypothetical protein